MSRKVKQILAIIALVFMGIFTVTFVMFLYNPRMFGGVLAFIVFASGVLGIGLFVTIKAADKEKKTDGEPPIDGEKNPNDDIEKEAGEIKADEKTEDEKTADEEPADKEFQETVEDSSAPKN